LILQILSQNEFDSMIHYLFVKDSKTMSLNSETPLTIEKTNKSYKAVVDELLAIPSSTPCSFPIFISWNNEDDYLLDGEVLTGRKYVDVGMINLNYVAPDASLKPYGCENNENPPEGHYNVNEEKHNKYYAFGLSDWSKIVDNEIISEITELKEYELLAEILWELTFYGWTSKEQENFSDMLSERVEEAKKEIEEGNCIKFPKETEKGLDVIIPDCVSRDLFSQKPVKNSAEGSD